MIPWIGRKDLDAQPLGRPQNLLQGLEKVESAPGNGWGANEPGFEGAHRLPKA